MKNTQDLVTQQQQNLQTQAGQTNTNSTSTKTNKLHDDKELKDSVAYLLMLLRDAYPAQFNRAYPSEEARDRVRSLWVAALKGIKPKRVRKAAMNIIRSGRRFMPSLGDVIEACRYSYEELGLKSPLQAYYEACNATCQRPDGSWSHKIVYLAAKATGWFFLRSEAQSVVFPLFEHNYHLLCERLQDGDDLEQDIQQGLEDFSKRSIIEQVESQEAQKLAQVMQQQGIDPNAGRQAFQDVMKEL